MTPSYITVEPAKEGKGRTFTAMHLARIVADPVWDRGGGSSIRPVLLVVGGPDTTVRPLVANLVLGRPATIDQRAYSRKGDKVELLKSAGYRVSWQRFPGPTGKGGDSIAWIYLPEPFSLDPGMVDPAHVRFALAPPKARLALSPPASAADVAHVRRVWAAKTAEKTKAASEYSRRYVTDPLAETTDEELVAYGPLATLFCAALDRRTPRPLLDDPGFRLQLLVASIEEGLAHVSGHRIVPSQGGRSFIEAVRTDDVGLGPCAAFAATQERVDDLLSTEVAWFMKQRL